ncbi:hypothetical protein PVAP13_9KG570902 [Panicum virgatum]|uniref:Uncharacterized protein n=1 Tax=Panicum virgatum TaxID=38727 RepID=A0A8T0P7E9_PANVG|nr:hypothetical protein PVAP13_9KG570902 [Panicum virgatum]
MCNEDKPLFSHILSLTWYQTSCSWLPPPPPWLAGRRRRRHHLSPPSLLAPLLLALLPLLPSQAPHAIPLSQAPRAAAAGWPVLGAAAAGALAPGAAAAGVLPLALAVQGGQGASVGARAAAAAVQASLPGTPGAAAPLDPPPWPCDAAIHDANQLGRRHAHIPVAPIGSKAAAAAWHHQIRQGTAAGGCAAAAQAQGAGPGTCAAPGPAALAASTGGTTAPAFQDA